VGVAWLRTSAVAVAAVSVVAAVCFGLQAATLGRPSRPETLIVRVIAELDRYHDSRARMTINGRPLTAVCTQRWGKRGRTETVVLDNGVRLERRGNKLDKRGKWALDEFELAGCPRSLTGWLTDAVNRGARIDIRLTRLTGGTRVYWLRVPSAQIGLELFINRRNLLPVELAISGPRIRAVSDITNASASAV
jgi:hypothetical protein